MLFTKNWFISHGSRLKLWEVNLKQLPIAYSFRTICLTHRTLFRSLTNEWIITELYWISGWTSNSPSLTTYGIYEGTGTYNWAHISHCFCAKPASYCYTAVLADVTSKSITAPKAFFSLWKLSFLYKTQYVSLSNFRQAHILGSMNSISQNGKIVSGLQMRQPGTANCPTLTKWRFSNIG